MKKLLLSLLTFCALSASAQRILVGDMNGDGVLSIEDVTWLTSTILGERDAKYHICVNEQHEYVDLGLPSGTLWATCNVGANSPEEYGDYFAWGEVDPKSTYDWSNYFDSVDGSNSNFKKYYNNGGKTELDLENDAAYMNWGEGWRMPSDAQLTELRENCTWTLTERNGKNGYEIKSKSNNNSIFLPTAGSYKDDTFSNTGPGGYYWSRSLSTSLSDFAFNIRFVVNIKRDYYDRYWGFSVRPVRASSSEESEDKLTTKSFTVNGVTFCMIPVEHGTFEMGSDSSEANSNEQPVHSVTISNDYYIGETEVTQALWYAVMGQKPTSDGSKWSSTYGLGDAYPAYYISWNGCQDFITKLNQLTGQTFRMPTEAEWEYAAKGGNKSQGYIYSGSNTIDDVAWYTSNSGSKTHPVATKAPNELGIYDMSGNVWEWCQDWYGGYSSNAQTNPTGPSSGSGRVYRGGSWFYDARYGRVAYRFNYTPSSRGNHLGLRLAL